MLFPAIFAVTDLRVMLQLESTSERQKSTTNTMKDIVSIIQIRIGFFLQILLLFHASTKTFVFAKTLPSQPSKAALTNLVIEKLNTCERAVWR